MTKCWDMTDVPTVAPAELVFTIRRVVGSIRTLTAQDATAVDLDDLETIFWQHYAGATGHGVALLLRLRSLIEVLSSRRVRTLTSEGADDLIRPLAEVAATMRLNVRWGFNPHKFLTALRAAMGEKTAVAAGWLEAA
jgi:hypothetical protein